MYIIYILSRDKFFLKVSNPVTRSAEKAAFKIPLKMLPVYEHSPYYVCTKLRNNLRKEVQIAPDVYAFEKRNS